MLWRQPLHWHPPLHLLFAITMSCRSEPLRCHYSNDNEITKRVQNKVNEFYHQHSEIKDSHGIWHVLSSHLQQQAHILQNAGVSHSNYSCNYWWQKQLAVRNWKWKYNMVLARSQWQWQNSHTNLRMFTTSLNCQLTSSASRLLLSSFEFLNDKEGSVLGSQ